MPTFKEEYTFEERLAESTRIREKYPDRVPIIVEIEEKHGLFTKTEKLPALDKKKYLTPDLSFSQFLYVIRKRIKLEPEKAMFMFIGDNGEIPPTGAYMSKLYDEFADEDGFLYAKVVGEQSFGLN